MGTKRISGLCRSVLPPEFEQVRQRIPAIQRFLEENLPEPLNRSVTLLTLNRDEIVIAANSPPIANYLRLHGAEIRQQLRETLGLEQRLRFRSVPDSLLQIDRPVRERKPQPASAGSIDALERNAQWIDDDELRAAMLSLAESLKEIR